MPSNVSRTHTGKVVEAICALPCRRRRIPTEMRRNSSEVRACSATSRRYGRAPVDPPTSRAYRFVAGCDWARLDYSAFAVGCVNCRVELARHRFNPLDYQRCGQVQRLRPCAGCNLATGGGADQNSTASTPVFEDVSGNAKACPSWGS